MGEAAGVLEVYQKFEIRFYELVTGANFEPAGVRWVFLSVQNSVDPLCVYLNVPCTTSYTNYTPTAHVTMSTPTHCEYPRL